MAEDTHCGIGEVLRHAREEAGLQISDLAATTRISARFIMALEAEDWEVVPGSVVGRGFVRVLARELGQDPGPLLEVYRATRGEEDATPDHSLPESDWDVSLRTEPRRSPLWIAACTALLLLAAGAWFWFPRSSLEDARAPAVPPAPVAQAAPDPVPAGPAESANSAPTPAASVPVEAVVAPAPAEAVALPGPADVVVAPHRLDIQAVEKVWVRVEADGGKPRDRLLEPGERAEFEGERKLRVKLGSAGSVRLTWDGTALRVPGKPGEVKTLEFPAAAAALRP